jgi:hypothetical protein
VFCHTLNTLSVAARDKKIIEIKKFEIYEKSGMSGIAVRGTKSLNSDLSEQ